MFLVHGRDDGAKASVTLFLERLGLEVIILHEQPNGGRTLMAKFIEEASAAAFAVVLMTADDLGRLASDTKSHPSARARQNVVFELGFFIGLIGASRVCALVAPGVERPSDFEAVAYVPFDAGATWKQELARELRVAGLPIDHDALLR
ncbi:MAG: nucleotide-binding protein [Phenylobacterium sp.]|uniref:nucleotide-binding protein n=1 Tax=Phenylobacterium sp. TaxID=1871053 RepID=UPI00271F683D|nr:nucleotide-binding protein [Phenylobacterium sp.]MDO8913462.1 nucleotide-binding protein [Phenylobacterium sp.]MDP3101833.1 nucleotide-binding protein [Phenylobacterium sp.]